MGAINKMAIYDNLSAPKPKSLIKLAKRNFMINKGNYVVAVITVAFQIPLCWGLLSNWLGQILVSWKVSLTVAVRLEQDGL